MQTEHYFRFLVIGVCGALVLSTNLSAQTTFSEMSGDFGSDRNWSNGVPGEGTGVATIADARQATISSTFRFKKKIEKLVVEDRAFLEIKANLDAKETTLLMNRASGTVNQTDGRVSLGSLDLIGDETKHQYHLSGGSLTIEGNLFFSDSTHSTFKLSGDKAELEVTGGGITIGAKSTLELELGPSGIRAITVNNLAINKGSTIKIDGSKYTSSKRKIDLITFGEEFGGVSGTAGKFDNVEITGFDKFSSGSIELDDNTLVLKLTK